MRNAFGGIVLAMSLAACASPPAPAVQRTGTSVAASKGKSWDAVILEFSENNIPIQTIDRSSGLIVSSPLVVSGLQAEGKADCGTTMGMKSWPTNVIYNVLVRGDSTSSVVKVTPRWTRTGKGRSLLTAGNDVTEDCSSLGTWETELEQHIRMGAEKK